MQPIRRFSSLSLRIAGRCLGLTVGGLVLLLIVDEGVNFSTLSAREAWLFAALFTSITAMLALSIPPWTPRKQRCAASVNVIAAFAFYGMHSLFEQSWPGGWVFPLMYAPGILEFTSHLMLQVSKDPKRRYTESAPSIPAAAPMNDLTNQPAPDFSLPDSGGKRHKLTDYCDRWLLLVFHRHLG